MLRPLLLCSITCLLSCSLFAQQITQQTLDELERQMIAAGNAAKVEKMLELADAYTQFGNLKEAADYAEDAADYAKSLRRSDLRARAYQKWGNILLKDGKKGAAGKLESSLELSRKLPNPDKNLMVDALTQLRILAQRNGKYKEIAAIDVQLAELKGISTGNVVLEPSNNRQELKQEVTQLSAQLAAQRAAKDTSEARMARLMAKSVSLQNQLMDKEAAINLMTAAQMKTELMLLQQNIMLDSLLYRTRLDSLAVSNTALELKEANTSRNFSYALAAILLLLCGGAIFSYIRARGNALLMAEKNKIIEAERLRSENLLLNILPALVADELKQQGHTRARFFEDASVLFADFVNFSRIAEKLTPQQLVTDLDTCFRQFDNIIAEFDLEKIKTIGDAYMCAGGLIKGSGSQLNQMISAARAMQQWLNTWNIQREAEGLPRYDARIGIHSGPLVAGVVGSRKFAFDIWGDTVNIAARIEQAGEGGKINISGPVYEAIKAQVNCRHRGKIAAKNKGDIDMYFVEN